MILIRTSKRKFTEILVCGGAWTVRRKNWCEIHLTLDGFDFGQVDRRAAREERHLKLDVVPNYTRG